MSSAARDLLIEQATSACRERNAWGRILPASAWWDLPPEARESVFQLQLEGRLIERALAPDGLSTTVRAVLERLR